MEWDINMLGGGGNPSAWYKVNGETGGFDQRKIVDVTDHVGMGNDYIGVELESRPTPPAAAWWSSIETMSLSGAGFEGNHQGGCSPWSGRSRWRPGEQIRGAPGQPRAHQRVIAPRRKACSFRRPDRRDRRAAASESSQGHGSQGHDAVASRQSSSAMARACIG